jgi:hypothetical protein
VNCQTFLSADRAAQKNAASRSVAAVTGCDDEARHAHAASPGEASQLVLMGSSAFTPRAAAGVGIEK